MELVEIVLAKKDFSEQCAMPGVVPHVVPMNVMPLLEDAWAVKQVTMEIPVKRNAAMDVLNVSKIQALVLGNAKTDLKEMTVNRSVPHT